MREPFSLKGYSVTRFWLVLVRLTYLLLLPVCFHSAALAQQFSVELLDENDGFSTSIVFSIVQDEQGFLWFGTAYDGIMRYDGKNVVNYRRNGAAQYPLKYNENGNLLLDSDGKVWVGGWGSSVSVLDPITNEVRNYPHEATNPNTVADSHIQSLFQDENGHMWFGARTKGLSRFDPETQAFDRFPYEQSISAGVGIGTSHSRIWAIEQVLSDELWLGTEFGLNHLDTKTREFEYFLPDPEIGPTGINKIRHIIPLSSEELLLGTHDGLLLFNAKEHSFNRVVVEQGVKLGPIYSMINTSFGQIWVATERGIYAFNAQQNKMSKVPLDFDDTCALTLFQDKQNIVWVSCEGKGIYKLVPQTFFKTLDHPIAQSAYALTMANDGNLLIGTQADGIYEWDWRNDRLSPFYELTGKNPPSVNRFTQDELGQIWFSDNFALYQINEKGSLTKVKPPAGTPNADKLTAISHIMQASDGRIWVSTAFGVFVIEELSKPFTYYGFDADDDTSVTSSAVAEVYEDKQGRIWLATHTGVNLWQPESDGFRRFTLPEQFETDPTDGVIFTMFQDHQMRVWVGSREGLLLIDEATGELVHRGSGDFGGSLGVRLIKGDSQGNLWLVTQVGLLKYNPETDELREFDERDGLPGARYFVNLATQSDSGTIFVSSRSGIHYFDPSLIIEDPLTSKTVLTNFEVLGAPTAKFNEIIANKSISLAPDENYIRFDFSTLDLLNARQIRYRYMLEGLDGQWIDNGTRNTVVYSNLRGGDYRFRVRPVIKNDLMYKDELVLDIHIATPIWRQAWMLVFYAVVVALIVGYYIRYRQARHEKEILRQKRFVSELESQVAEKTREIRHESEKLVEANKVKSQFLANMSHEIRTPLTAIIGLSESIIRGDVEGSEVNAEVGRIHNQSRHLLSLLNDILDVTKIEENKLELEPYDLDISALLNEINDLFVSQAMAKRLKFNIISQLPPKQMIHVDGLRLKQILINLISNAIKFTEQGQVSVVVSQQQSLLLFNVVDTGIGMSDEQLQKVFEFFIQADNSINRRFGGSGLGLALSKKLVSMMGGDIQVSSELGKGSVFTFTVPVQDAHSLAGANIQHSQLENMPSLHGDVLLAEDHPDNRRFIARLLKRLGLNVITANNGIEAIELYKKSTPQLILLDIQMPLKDGIQTYQELRAMGAKQPIIAVTANAMAHDVVMYKDIGFDDYLTKPIFRQQLIDIIKRYFDSGIDVDSACEVLDNTETDDLRDEFIARLESEIAQFQLARDNDKEIRELAHRLAGAAEIFGFKQLASAAADLERAAREQPGSVPELLDGLLAKMKQFQG